MCVETIFHRLGKIDNQRNKKHLHGNKQTALRF